MSNSSNSNSRIFLFDALKLFAIFMVLWGHAIQYLRSSDFTEEPVYRVIYSFHMPLFMMIVGFFFARTFRPGFFRIFCKKFRQLIYPTLVWCLIFSILMTIKMRFPTFDYICQNYENYFWFLKCAFICCVLSYPICKLQTHRLLLGGVLIISQLPYSNNLQISFMYPCFLCGMALQWYAKDLQRINQFFLLAITGLIFIIGNYFLDAKLYRLSMSAIYTEPLWANGYVIPLRLFRIVLGVSATIFIICAMKLLIDKYKNSRFYGIISTIGVETLGIYILQSLILEYILARHINMDNISFGIFNFIVAPLLSLILLLIIFAIIRILKFNQYTAAFFFGDRISSTETAFVRKK